MNFANEFKQILVFLVHAVISFKLKLLNPILLTFIFSIYSFCVFYFS